MNKVWGLIIMLLFQSCFFLGPSAKKRLKTAKSKIPYDVAIVPGLPLHGGRWDTLLKARILWSVFLYQKGYVRKILYSGNAVYTPWIEGRTMALYARQLGIPENDILIDTLAEHSIENLFYGQLLARSNGLKNMVVATDPFQCAMLYRYARKNYRNDMVFLPIVYDSIAKQQYPSVRIDTSLTVRSSFVPLPERENYRERNKGTHGKHIPKKPR